MKEQMKLDLLHLNITNECNLRCEHCYNMAGEQLIDELSTEELITIAREIVKLKVRAVHVEGGEPFFREDVFELIHELNRVPMLLIVSNGTLINDRIVSRLKQSGLKKIAISLDSANQATHNKIRHMTHDKALNAISYFKQNSFYVRLSTVLMRHNFKEIPDLIDLCIDKNVDVINIDNFELIGRGKNHPEYQLRIEDWKEFDKLIYNKCEDVRSEINIKINIPEHLFGKIDIANDSTHTSFIKCDAGKRQLLITPNGYVMPCFIMQSLLENRNYIFGNVREDSIEKIWKEHIHENVVCPIGVMGHVFYSNR